jgi:mRNA-degrading endonuclease YafQ of YafQ-DinJ toxin-antitoxin module
MTEIALSSSFKRAFKKRVAGNANAEARFWERVEEFKSDSFNPKLRTHKLPGKLKVLGFQYRI